MAAGDLTTVAAAKAWGKIGSTTDDTAIAALVTAASAWIASKASQVLTGGPVTFNEIRHGTGGTELFLAEGPATGDLTLLTINGVVIPKQAADQQPGWFYGNNGEVVCLEGYVFTRGKRNVRVSYPSGYALPPADIVQACNEIVVSMYRRGERGPDMSMKVVEGQNLQWSLRDIPVSAASVVQRYSRVVPL